jgi:hypothetical protein
MFRLCFVIHSSFTRRVAKLYAVLRHSLFLSAVFFIVSTSYFLISNFLQHEAFFSGLSLPSAVNS